MSPSRTLIAPDEDELLAEENPLLEKLLAAMNRRVPSEEDRKLLLALGRAICQLREERGMTPAELAQKDKAGFERAIAAAKTRLAEIEP
ncbi:MAG TPA: hypothetical protein VNY52_07205 [Solirubrobacteraceae bacterium]|jgi:hypothetical protein|nr:hypothetical protein [Solirubrobacteraceae bacterium]